jgi:hypothetical protein
MTRVEMGQPRPPRDEHGNAATAAPLRNTIRSSVSDSTCSASRGAFSMIERAASTISRACSIRVAIATA